MKILFLNPDIWNYYRVRAIELPTVLSKSGHECIYINPVRYKGWEKRSTRLHDVSENEIPQNLTVVKRESHLPKSFRVWLYESFDNISMIKKYKPDVVIASDHLMSLAACIYCKIKNIKFIFDVTDDWEEVDTNKFTRFYWKHIAKPLIGKLSYSITSSSYRQAEIFKKYNSKTYTITNGKPNAFIEQTEKYHAVISKNEINFIAQLRDWYDFDLLFAVFKEFPELNLNIYGKGELYEYLLKKSESYSNIKVLGNVDGKYVPKLTAESLFGILPLKSTKLNDSTCPVKLFEYWAAKKVVIASPTYELQQIGKDCILFAGTKEEYIQQIRSILNDKKLRNDIGEVGYKKVKETYNYENIGKRFEEIL